jgi:hypothetical protein
VLIVQGKEHKSDQPAFLEVIFIDADGGFRKLATFLGQALDVFADEVGSRFAVSFTCLRPNVVIF